MTQMISRWTPPSDVVDHTGDPIPSDAIFFTPPPAQIGEIYTAHSGWVGSKKPGSGAGSIALIIVLALVGAIVGGFLLFGISSGQVAGLAVGALIGGGLSGYLTYRSESRKNCNTYTGAQGIARYIYSEDAVKREQGDIFSFANAVELRTSQTRRYTNGIYSGTSYSFGWTGRDGKPVYKLAGSYSSEKGTPHPNDPYYYARAAEFAWSSYMLKFVQAELDRSGAFRFNLRGNNCVVAGQGYLDLYMNGQQIRCATNEIAKVEMYQGVITVRRKDAKDGFLGIGSTGIFKFTYAELANGRVFLMLLEKLVGFQF